MGPALYEDRVKNFQRGHPSERCLTHGVTDFDTHLTPRRIIQTPQIIAILFESYNHYRQIYLDGRPLPKSVQPAYLGYSVGKWEGDTLIVETAGLNDKGWLDMNGHPQNRDNTYNERFRRRNWAYRSRGHYRRPEGLCQTLDSHAGRPGFSSRRRPDRIDLRKRKGLPAHGWQIAAAANELDVYNWCRQGVNLCVFNPLALLSLSVQLLYLR